MASVGFTEAEMNARITKGIEAVTAIETVAKAIDGTGTNTSTAIRGGWEIAQKQALVEVNQAATKLRNVMDERNNFLRTYKDTTWGADQENATTTTTAAGVATQAVAAMNPA